MCHQAVGESCQVSILASNTHCPDVPIEPLVLSCKGCGEELVFEPPPGSFTFASGSQKDCGTLAEFNGFWIGRYINHAGEPVIDRRFKMPLLT